MTQAQSTALWMLLDVIEDSVAVAGDQGAPGGVLYAAMMHVPGMTLERFEILMAAMVKSGRLRRSGHLYFAAEGGS